jgi:3-oxoacyl-[acyl-carrier protein] reductase
MTFRSGLTGRHALVFGGTSEIAQACVQRLCEEGMSIAITGAHRELGRAIAERTGAVFVECDRRERADTDRAVERALQLGGGRLDVLVASADVASEGSIEATSEAVFRELVEVNMTSLFRVTRACLRPMRANGAGSVILIASSVGIRAAHETAAFSVTSAGVIAIAELLAAEGATHGVRCNAVCPGESLDGEPGAAGGPRVTGGDVAALVAWLASDESAHLTGATLRLDAGAGAAMVVDTRV